MEEVATKVNVAEVNKVMSGMTTDERMLAYNAFFDAVITRSALNRRSQGNITYEGRRDIYKVLGYKKTLCYADFYSKYKRLDIASAVIDTQVETSFHGGFSVYEGERDENETEFEKAYKELDKKHNLTSLFTRADTLAMLGQYSGILLGLSDVKSTKNLTRKPDDSKKELMYARPISEEFLNIAEVNSNPVDPRYTKPETYDVAELKPENTAGAQNARFTKGNELTTYRFHADRVVHIAYDVLENELYGTPALEKVYNTLDNIEKIVGAAAEMFWRGGRPGYQANVTDEYSYSEEMKKAFLEELSKYENDMSRVVVAEGVELKDLSQEIKDPTGAFMVNIQLLCAAMKIPLRILLGSERGELASTQDRSTWHERIEGRRIEKVEKLIIRPVIDRFIQVGVLPAPKDPYKIYWADLMSLSERDKAEIGKLKSEALKNYLSVPGATKAFPPDLFAKVMLYLDPVQVERIDDELTEAVKKELMDMAKPAGTGPGSPAKPATKGS